MISLKSENLEAQRFTPCHMSDYVQRLALHIAIEKYNNELNKSIEAQRFKLRIWLKI